MSKQIRIFQCVMEGGGAYNHHARHQTAAASVAGQFLESAVGNLALASRHMPVNESLGGIGEIVVGVEGSFEHLAGPQRICHSGWAALRGAFLLSPQPHLWRSVASDQHKHLFGFNTFVPSRDAN
jgi:hypothetical protein